MAAALSSTPEMKPCMMFPSLPLRRNYGWYLVLLGSEQVLNVYNQLINTRVGVCVSFLIITHPKSIFRKQGLNMRHTVVPTSTL